MDKEVFMKNKKKIIIVVAAIAVSLIGFSLLNSTYSLFYHEETSKNTEGYSTGTLSITASSKGSTISLSDALPVEDSVGSTSTPYTFTISNTGNLNYKFNIKLLSTGSSSTTIGSQYIKLKVDDGSVTTLSSLSNGIIKKDVTLAAGESIDISVRVWLSISTPNSQIGKTFNSKIVIDGQAVYTETKEYTDGTKTAVIPGGFTVSGIRKETRIDEGLVIYLIPDDEIENVKWDGTEKTKYDQFVWIPVTDVNKMFMCQSKTANTECNIELVNGKPTCTNHSNSTNMAGRLYETSVGGDRFNSSLTIQTYNANDGLREPAIVTGKADGTGTKYDGSSNNNIGLTLSTLQEEYNSAVKKVIESKGFWIGRYETSGMNSSNDDIAVNIVAGKGIEEGISNEKWYRMYKQQQNYVGKKNLDTSKIQSTMVFGAAYDQTMIFANCATETTPKKDISTVITGNVETDCYKNIYDLCGNLYEWTTEAVYNFSRVSRGRRLRQQLFC